jgi:hypothetical protein
MAKKVADFYVTKQGSRYIPVYTTPESTAVPTLERWIVLVLETKAFLDFTNPQRIVTLPLSIVDRFYLGVEKDKRDDVR